MVRIKDGNYIAIFHDRMIEVKADSKKDAYNKAKRYFESREHRELFDGMKWIKNKLPWYITKFCRISSNEIILKDTSIFIGVNFGKSARSNCYIELTPRDID